MMSELGYMIYGRFLLANIVILVGPGGEVFSTVELYDSGVTSVSQKWGPYHTSTNFAKINYT
jgi:hypothetical protein